MSSDDNENQAKVTFTYLKSRLLASLLMVLIASTVMIPGMTTYLPIHQNDAIGIPILLFPFIWTGLFIYCFLAESVKRIWLLLTFLTLVHVALVYFTLAG